VRAVKIPDLARIQNDVLFPFQRNSIRIPTVIHLPRAEIKIPAKRVVETWEKKVDGGWNVGGREGSYKKSYSSERNFGCGE
jgi:hypothetical protein